jgi:hypothetical protein
MEFALNLPLGVVSFGQVSTLILREIHKKCLDPCIFPIGNQVDLSSQSNLTPEFGQWLQNNVNKALKTHKRTSKILKLWHLNGALESLSDKQVLFTFYECSNPTAEEINIAKNQEKVIFSCDYAANLFKDFGCNVSKIPLAFDKYNFYKKDKEYFTDGRISFLLPGKFEITRKRTKKIIQAWVKKFGNNRKYFLNCAVANVFLNQDQQNALFRDSLNNQHVPNVQFLGFTPQNDVYNDILNANEIVIGMGTEGWGLPQFSAIAMGKYGVILNCSGHKEWANSENSILVNPSGLIPAYDGMFFHQGQPWNQGNFYDFNEDEFIAACELAIKKVEQNKVNEAGLKLQEQFTSEKFVDSILKELE